jgi:hypothetical protein
MMSRKDLPKKLEEDLEKIRQYKPNAPSSKSIGDIMDDSVERAMYDEILGPLLNKSSARPTVRLDNTQRVIPSLTTSSTDFTTTLLTRLKLVETEAKEARRKLVEQITYNGKLEREIVDLKSFSVSPQDVLDDLETARQQNRHLQHKIREMEKFLADYGLEWVGPSDAVSVADDDVSEGEDEKLGATHHVSFADFNRHIQELNAVVYSEPAQIVTEGNYSRKARLVQASELVENIKVVYYRNGLFIQRGPFRPCDSETYTSFVEDILDGYFPSEFKKTYPDGVTFDLKDRHDVEYREGHPSNHEHHPHMATRQFLDRLPKTVIRNGELVDIRTDIDRRLNGGGGGVTSNCNSGEVNSGVSAGAKGAAADAAESRAQSKRVGGSVHSGDKTDKHFASLDSDGKPLTSASVRSGVSTSSIKAGTVVLSTPAAAELVAQRGGNSTDEAVSERIVQVQVKWTEVGLSGGLAQQQLLLVHMFEHDTVRDLREQIARWVGESYNKEYGGDKKCDANLISGRLDASSSTQRTSLGSGEAVAIELRNVYPPKVLSDAYTLREAGLVPNGTVHGRRL